jgi:hypothetical protein
MAIVVNIEKAEINGTNTQLNASTQKYGKSYEYWASR